MLPDRLLPQEDSTLFGLLRRAGFEDGLLAAIKDSPELEGLEALPTSHGLAEVSHWLKRGSMESSTDLRLIESPSSARPE